jgi:hypothetical protein
MVNQRFRVLVLAAAAALAALILVPLRSDTQAHANCNAPYYYNKDIFPILRDHCSSCHVPGGPAPMSLLNFKDAQQWASSVRDELTTERMPPWHVDPASPAIKGAHPIGGRDIDMVVYWASCNTPRVPSSGDDGKPLPTVTFNPQWKLGPPDLKIEMPSAHTVAAESDEETIDVDVPTGLTEAKWVKAVDLMAGTAPLLRDAVVSVTGSGGNAQVLALWQPGGDAVASPSGAAFHLAAGSSLHLQMHYKKHYLDSGKAMSDKSTVGLYFTDAPASGHELASLAIDGPAGAPDAADTETFSATLPGAARVVALRPMLDRPYDSLEVTAVTSTGRRTTLVKLRSAWPQWFRRYWLEEPIELAGGTTIEVRATPHVLDSDDPREPKRFPLQVALDYVPQGN